MFNESDFMKTSFKERTTEVEVKELKDFFKDADPVWTVRGLTGEEIARVNNSIEKNATLMALSTALRGNAGVEKVNALRELLGISTDEVPSDLIRKKESLMAGSVNPECSEELAVKLAQAYPTVFFQLTQEIMRLTGMGQDPGKQKPSGDNQASEKA